MKLQYPLLSDADNEIFSMHLKVGVHSSFYPTKAIHEADRLMISYNFLLPAISVVLTSHVKLPTHHLQENCLDSIEHLDITHTEAKFCMLNSLQLFAWITFDLLITVSSV